MKINRGSFVDTLYLIPAPVIWWDIYDKNSYSIAIDLYLFKWYIGIEITKGYE